MPMELIHDTLDFPLWIRIPGLTFGLFCIGIATAVISDATLGSTLLPPTVGHARPTQIYDAIIPLIIGLAWSQIWFSRTQIMHDRTGHRVIVSRRILFSKMVRDISLTNAAGITLRHSFRSNNIVLAFHGGYTCNLCRANDAAVMTKIARALNLIVLAAKSD